MMTATAMNVLTMSILKAAEIQPIVDNRSDVKELKPLVNLAMEV